MIHMATFWQPLNYVTRFHVNLTNRTLIPVDFQSLLRNSLNLFFTHPSVHVPYSILKLEKLLVRHSIRVDLLLEVWWQRHATFLAGHLKCKSNLLILALLVSSLRSSLLHVLSVALALFGYLLLKFGNCLLLSVNVFSKRHDLCLLIIFAITHLCD